MNKKSIVKDITNMIILNIIVLITVLALHEFGHALGGKLIGCDEIKAVIFDSRNGAYTELNCKQNEEKQNIAYLSSLIFTGLFGLSFLTFDKKTQKSMIFVALGFGILLAGIDIVVVTGLEFMKQLFVLFGLTIMILGEILVGLFYASE